MKEGRPALFLFVIFALPILAFAQSDQIIDLAIIRLAALAVGIIAAALSWKWYFSTVSKPPVLLWLGIGMVSELLIKWLLITMNPQENSPPELFIAALQVVSGAFFLNGLWAFLCTRWIRASPHLAKQFLLVLSIVIIALLGYGVLLGESGNKSLITYAIYVLTAFWMLLYIFITLMALYAYIRTDEMMLAWFSAGFSMMVFASWYRLIYFQNALLPEQQIVSSLLPLLTSACYIIGVFLFQRAGKA
jgi:hypothetical protein